MRRLQRAVMATFLAALILACPSGCGKRNSTASTPTSGATQLTIISPHPEGVRREYTDAFEAYMKAKGTLVELKWIDQGGTSDDVKFVQSEFTRSPKGINIDVFWGGGIDPYLKLTKLNLLEKVDIDKSILSHVAKDLMGVPVYDPGHRWYGTALSGFGIMYNKVALRDEKLPIPTTWEDLGHKEYFNRVGATDPRHSGSAHMMYEIVLQAYGWDKGWQVLTSYAANANAFTTDSAAATKDVRTGEVLAAPAIDFFARTEIADVGADKLGLVLPAGLTVVNPDSIGILKGAPHKELAKQLIEYALSEAGQKLLMLPKGAPGGPQQFNLGRLSVLPDLYKQLGKQAITPENPFTAKSLLKYDPQKGSTRWDILNDMLGALLIDTHDELQAAWKKARPEDLPALSKPPITEAEAMKLARTKWSDPTFRNITRTAWVTFARNKYEAIGH